MRGLSTEGNLRFKIDWASLIVRSEFTVFALFYFVFEGNFPSTSPRGGLYLEELFNGGLFALRVWGAYIWRSYLTEGFLRYRFGGLVHGGAYFRNFTVFYGTLLRNVWRVGLQSCSLNGAFDLNL